jgi:ankyrin repeat protein
MRPISNHQRQHSIQETIFNPDRNSEERDHGVGVVEEPESERLDIPAVNQVEPIIHRPESASVNSDEGYETGATPMRSPSSMISRRKTFTRATLNVFRKSSFASDSAKSEPILNRSPSDCSWGDVPIPPVPAVPQNKYYLQRRTKSMLSRLARITTRSVPNLASQTQSSRARKDEEDIIFARRRGLDMNMQQSIDFTSIGSLYTPALVRAAQSGSRAQIQQLLENHDDIEACHIPTRRTALSVAAHCGNTELVDLLLKNNADSSTRDMHGSTPLHLASSRGHYDVVELLLKDGTTVETPNHSSQTALWLAADGCHSKVVELLVKCGARIDTRASDQLTPLHNAAKSGERDMAALLLKCGSHIESREAYSKTALHYACENGHLNVAELLLDKGAYINSLGKDLATPLICAAANGHLQIVELLVRRKASLQAHDREKANALHWASKHGHTKLVEYFLKSKLSIQEKDAEGMTPLHLAAKYSHFDVVELLLRRKASLELSCNEGRTPLHYGSASDNPDIVRLLINAGAHPEARVAKNNQGAVHIAAAKGSVQMIEVLKETGVSLGTRDSVGDRALCIACHHGHLSVVEKLLEYNEPIRARFEDKPNEDSPLCIAAKAGHVEVVSFLIAKGASVKQRDDYGKIPLHYAACYGHPEVVDLLLKCGAQLVDDGEDSNGWGFLLMPDKIKFADELEISEERKELVRELLQQAAISSELGEDQDSSHGRSSGLSYARTVGRAIAAKKRLSVHQIRYEMDAQTPGTESGVTGFAEQKQSLPNAVKTHPNRIRSLSVHSETSIPSDIIGRFDISTHEKTPGRQQRSDSQAKRRTIAGAPDGFLKDLSGMKSKSPSLKFAHDKHSTLLPPQRMRPDQSVIPIHEGLGLQPGTLPTKKDGSKCTGRSSLPSMQGPPPIKQIEHWEPVRPKTASSRTWEAGKGDLARVDEREGEDINTWDFVRGIEVGGTFCRSFSMPVELPTS